MPTVSVIIPVYKSERFIKKAVGSVLTQSFSDFEIILVDDGSPDDSLKLCQELSEQDSRIRVYHKENGGICSARNYGIERATGKYLAFLDHDDEYMEGYLEENLALIMKYDADVIKFGRINKMWTGDGEYSLVHEKRLAEMPGLVDGVGYFDKEQIAKNFCRFRDAVKALYIWDAIYLTDFINRNHIRFDEKYRFGHEDKMLNIEVFSAASSAVFNAKEYYLHNYDVQVSTSAKYHPVRIDDSIRTIVAEVNLLKRWNTEESEILVSIMNEYFMVMNILNLKSGKLKYREQKAAVLKFRDSTFPLLENAGEAIRKLRKRDKKTALWAVCLKNKWILISVLMFKAYRRFMA